MRRIFLGLLTVVLVAGFSRSASAHFLWLLTEPAGHPTRVQVFFGEAAEPDDPDLLDRVAAAQVWAMGGRAQKSRKLELNHANDALTAELPEKLRQSAIVLKHEYGVLARGDARFALNYYGKTYPTPLPGTWKAVEDAEKLPLEIVPSLDGDTLVLHATWQGKPAAGDEITIVGPGVEESLQAALDEEGNHRVALPKSAGVFSVRVKHVEEKSGELDGKAYDSIRHYSTLALPYTPASLSAVSHQLPELPLGITSFGAAVAGDAYYIYGGNYRGAHEYWDEGQSGDFWKLDLKGGKEWQKLSSGPRLQGLAMVEHGGDLYRVGGFTAKNKEGEEQDLHSQADFARFNTAERTWESLPDLPEGRSSHDAAVLGDTLYVVGGWTLMGADAEAHWHTTAWAMDLSADMLAWKPIAAPPFERRAVAVAAWGGKIYCIGGMQHTGGTTTAVAVYDPAQNAWSEGPSLLGSGMDGFGSSAFACGEALYVTTISGSIQRLAGAGEGWEYVGQLEHPRFFHRMLPWDGKLVIAGGASMSVGKILETEVVPVGGR